MSESDVQKLDGKKPASKPIVKTKSSTQSTDKVPDKERYRTTTTSIKNAFKQPVQQKTGEEEIKSSEKEIQDNNVGDNLSTEPFTTEQMQKAWNDYAEKIVDKPRMRNTVLSFTPEIVNENKMVLKLMNKAQVEEFSAKVKPGILNFIRKKLNNGQIELQIEEDIKGEIKDARAFTPGDKLKEFIEKNPAVGQLKQRFNLDLE